jgi:hypothetical protein
MTIIWIITAIVVGAVIGVALVVGIYSRRGVHHGTRH